MPWRQLLGGKKLDFADPDPALIDWNDIATVLARIPRYTGHTESGVLSVAQHCVGGARAIQRDGYSGDVAAAFLIHDAHEAFIGDIGTPTLDALAHHAVMEAGDLGAERIVRAAMRGLKRSLDAAIYSAAGIPWPLDVDVAQTVREYDLRMLRTERDWRMAPPPEPWIAACENAKPIEDADLFPWSEYLAREEWIEMARELLPALRLRADWDTA